MSETNAPMRKDIASLQRHVRMCARMDYFCPLNSIMASVFIAKLKEQQESLDSFKQSLEIHQAQINSLKKFSKQNTNSVKDCLERITALENNGVRHVVQSTEEVTDKSFASKLDEQFEILDAAIDEVNKDLLKRIEALEKCHPGPDKPAKPSIKNSDALLENRFNLVQLQADQKKDECADTESVVPTKSIDDRINELYQQQQKTALVVGNNTVSVLSLQEQVKQIDARLKRIETALDGVVSDDEK